MTDSMDERLAELRRIVEDTQRRTNRIGARDGVHPQTPGNTVRKVMAALRQSEGWVDA